MDPLLQKSIDLYNPWWFNKQFDTGIIRSDYLNSTIQSLSDKRITFLLGSRRVGKTYLLFQTIFHLLSNQHIDPKKILFLSLDNPEFKRMNLMQYILAQDYAYVFLDEIHYYDNWQQILKSLYDIPSLSISIVCSGSSSVLIEDHKAYLTGRHTSDMIYPLSFLEFQQFSQQKQYTDTIESYLEYGGYPEYVLERQPTYLTELIGDIIEKDIVSQYNIRRQDVLFQLLQLIGKQIGFRTSSNKLSHVLNITDDTVKTYLHYLENVNMVRSIQKYAASRNERIYSPRKYYFFDTGMRTQLIGFGDIGSLVENAVFMHIIRTLPSAEVFYVSDRAQFETDFLLIYQGKSVLIEVKYESFQERITQKIPPSFYKDIYNLDIQKRIVVTKDLHKRDVINTTTVDFVPLEQFLKGKYHYT